MAKLKKQADTVLEDDELDNEEEVVEDSDLENEDADDNTEGLSKGKGKSKDKPAKGEEESVDDEEAEEEESEEEDTRTFLPKSFKVPKELEPLYKQMQSGLNKKFTELDKRYKGKKVVGSYEELLKDPEFLTWAEKTVGSLGSSGSAPVDLSQFSMDEIVQYWPKLSEGQRRSYWGGLDATKQDLFKLKLQLYQVSQNTIATKEASLEEAVKAKYPEYATYSDKIRALRTEVARNPYLHHDEAFKILDYDEMAKRMYKKGLLDGRKGVKTDKDKFVPAKPGASTVTKHKVKAKSVREAFDQAEEEEGEE